jgi:hypothetical protein
MHVLPLPFGLALALLSRRDADKLRPEQHTQQPPAEVISITAVRERIYADNGPWRVA